MPRWSYADSLAMWEVCCLGCDTLAPSYSHITSQLASSAAAILANKKEAKYTNLVRSYYFIPTAFNLLRLVDDRCLTFLKELGKHMTAAIGDARETTFFSTFFNGYSTFQLCAF